MKKSMLNEEVIKRLLQNRTLGVSLASCAAQAGVPPSSVSSWIRRGNDIRSQINSGELRSMPRKNSFERRCLDLSDQWDSALAAFERRNLAIVQKSAQGHWSPDHRYEEVWEDGRPLVDSKGAVIKKRVTVTPSFIPPKPQLALELLERVMPSHYGKAAQAQSVINVTTSAVSSEAFLDVSDLSPEQISALIENVNPEEVFIDEEEEDEE